ncbi:MAG: ComEC/Rec2 family competence protein [Alphaproteobacteria bacterium]|nr:ComEC/Rec2 family competence protein [Alphaproteobacteria bacterium]
MRFSDFLLIERQTLPLFMPVILGVSIIVGVFFPFFSWRAILVAISMTFLLSIEIWKRSKTLCYTILTFMLGIYIAQTGGIFNIDLLSQKRFITKEYDKVTFTAVIDAMDETHPVMKNMRRITFKDINIKNINLIKTEKIKTAKMTCSAKMSKNVSPGDIVRIHGKFIPFKSPAIPGAFDQAQYNALVGIDVTGIVYGITKLGQTHKFYNCFSKIRCSLTKRVLKKMQSPAGGIACALLTGDKSAIQPEVRERFIASGTAHILAISGLHMSIVSSVIFFVLAKIFQYANCIGGNFPPKKLSAIITILITFLYLALSGFSPSATRAFIMTTVCLFGVVVGRGVLSLRSVAFAAFVILLCNSGAVFLVSFQLSFCAVVSLIAFYEFFRPMLSAFIVKHSGIMWKMSIYILLTLVTTIIASLSTLPVSIAVFNRLSLSGLLGNIVAIPTMTFVIVPLGILCLVLRINGLIDMLSFVLNKLYMILSYISDIPGSNIVVKSPEISALYMIIIGGIILCLLRTKIRLSGIFFIITGASCWIFQTSPDIVFPPKTPIACFVEDSNFYATSLRKGRNFAFAIQRNLGFSGKLNKKAYTNTRWEIAEYPNGLYVWSKSGKTKQLASRKHPYCPAYWVDF